jgi:hypothetical protein
MTDTPQHIKDLQLKIWLSKTPMERLYQSMKDNEDLITFWKVVKPVSENKKTQSIFSKQ